MSEEALPQLRRVSLTGRALRHAAGGGRVQVMSEGGWMQGSWVLVGFGARLEPLCTNTCRVALNAREDGWRPCSERNGWRKQGLWQNKRESGSGEKEEGCQEMACPWTDEWLLVLEQGRGVSSQDSVRGRVPCFIRLTRALALEQQRAARPASVEPDAQSSPRHEGGAKMKS
ncbi:hypothetical protein CC78DRAFT_579133 [Lojkania enalia]|uniref:Uncharacterized protein n=1 Tax=Lojkania enalia TaxID=147567 RepID=A0A9P4N731_9PLEO|nr:hypothetical protein CC78DRAFT_579133 [Didymosphaeria enalia]